MDTIIGPGPVVHLLPDGECGKHDCSSQTRCWCRPEIEIRADRRYVYHSRSKSGPGQLELFDVLKETERAARGVC